MYSVGLDYHSSRSSVHILEPQGACFKAFEVKGDWRKLLRAIDSQVPKPFAICFEASCGYGHLYDELARRAARVEVAHPGELRLIFRAKKKHDRIDAAKIAKVLHLDMVPRVHIPALQVRQWRSIIEFRRRVVGRISAIKSQLRALCRGLGIHDLPKGKALYTRKGIAQLQQQALPELSALQRDLLLDQLASLHDQKLRIEKQLKKIAHRDPRLVLLKTIPGVGVRTAEAFLAYVDDIRRFARINRVGCYFGMVPCEDSSSDQRRLGHITKDGPGTVRWLICEAAWQAINRSPTVRAFYERVIHGDPDRRKLALVAVGHYLLRVMAAMLRSGEVWRETVKQEDLPPAAPPMKRNGPTRDKSRPHRLVAHDGAQVASQQSPILRVDASSITQDPAGASAPDALSGG